MLVRSSLTPRCLSPENAHLPEVNSAFPTPRALIQRTPNKHYLGGIVRSTSSKKTTRLNSSVSKKPISTGTKLPGSADEFLTGIVGKLTFAKLLRATRLSDDLSQPEFADKLGISKQHLCDIEKGRKIVSPARAWAWAKKLGYHPKQWAELTLQDMLEKDGLKGVTVRLEVA